MKPLTHVACVEDDADILQVAELALSSIGGLKVTAIDGSRSALDALAAAQPDLVLLDVMMPGADDLATLKAMAAHDRLKHLPVVFLTARLHDKDLARYRAAGALGVIAKPFDPLALADEVKRLWSAHPA
jgi:CheY-like chemotaxis protein